jgi:SAM-dependent methyltransferase
VAQKRVRIATQDRTARGCCANKEKDMKSLYDFPEIYDQILCHDPSVVAQEATSIVELLRREGVESGSVLELACGTCAHAVELATRGFNCSGIDLSQAMLEGARRRASRAGVELDLRSANVIDFEWTDPVDAVIFMSETFPLITEFADIKSHFAAVRRALRPGGLYIVDIDAHRHGVGDKHEVWGERTVAIKGGEVEIWHESFPGDWVQGTTRTKMHCRIKLGGATYETQDEWVSRVDSPWNLRVLIESLGGWSVEGFYSWRDLSPEIQNERHCFMVLK